MFSTISDPGIPTLSSPVDIHQDSVILSWHFGGTEIRNSSVVFYMDVSCGCSWKTSAPETLTDLTPGHTYVFYLEVTSFGKTVRSANQTVTTRECICLPLYYMSADLRIIASDKEVV